MTKLAAWLSGRGRERAVLLGGVAGIVALSWLYLADMAAMMDAPAVVHTAAPWSGGYFLMMFLMWAIMMAAMMLPSIIHVILLFLRVARASGPAGRPVMRTWCFIGGYVLAWTGFSLVATLAQWALDTGGHLSARMSTASPLLAGSLLILAGLYQGSALKRACLEHCRGPVHFLSRRWCRTPAGAVRMGLAHGLYCIGCCWALMALLFVGGVMNLLWIAALALFVLLEKLLPPRRWLARLTAGLPLLAGGVLVGQALV